MNGGAGMTSLMSGFGQSKGWRKCARLTVLAAAALAWAYGASAQPSTSKGASTDPKWLHKPRADELNALWPAEAEKRGIGGSAVIECTVTLSGTTTGCTVVTQSPPNMGFGAAALQLAPTFLFTPGTVNGQPVSSSVTVPIRFGEPGFQGFSETRDPEGSRVIIYQARTELPWLTAPSSAQVAATFPAKAKGAVPSGHVVLRCMVAKDGLLKDCSSVSEVPTRLGFTQAAKTLAPLFKVDLENFDVPASKLMVDLAFQLIDPSTPAWRNRAIAKPTWIRTVNFEAVELLYPAAARAAGVKTGRGVARCVVTASGQLAECKSISEEPDHLGFGEAAAKVAEQFVMNRWTSEGLPVDGQPIIVPVRLESTDPAKKP